MRDFDSGDFDKTPPVPVAVIPDRLLHRAVVSAGEHDGSSAERKHPVFFVDLPSKTISMTIGGLGAGRATGLHRHTYETILYILEGTGHSEIEGRRVDWTVGDAVYLPVWAWHRHVAGPDGPARYIACENAPLLQNLGGIALREEAEVAR